MVVLDSDGHVVAKEDEGVSVVDLLAGIDDPNKEGGLGRGYGGEVEDGLGVKGVEDGATVVELAVGAVELMRLLLRVMATEPKW